MVMVESGVEGISLGGGASGGMLRFVVYHFFFRFMCQISGIGSSILGKVIQLVEYIICCLMCSILIEQKSSVLFGIKLYF